jgi:uncharacterized glyoxalase superfamily protein PhnB
MQTFISIVPCFPVADVGETIRWYESNLGFSGGAVPDQEPFVFGILRREGVEIMLQRMPGYQKPDLYDLRAGGVWNAYVRMKSVNDLYESVKNKVEIKQPLRRQPYGQIEFEVIDPNGYILVFSEAD